MRAEIITIGTELLLGEIVDTNTTTIAKILRDLGVDLFRCTTVGDNAERICGVVQESLMRADVVLTSGGLGPTVDDATREGISRAFSLPLEFREELWAQIQARFARFGVRPTENNRQQAQVPQGSLAVENPVGTAPAFIVEGEDATLIALPGVPSELQVLLDSAVEPYLRERFGLGDVIHTRTLRTVGVGESALDSRIRDLELLDNPTVGLAAHPGQVDIRITAKAETTGRAREMISEIEADLLGRVGEFVYAYDSDTLEGVVLDRIQRMGWQIYSIEAGTGGLLAERLAAVGGPFAGGVVLPISASEQGIEEELARAKAAFGAEVGLGLHLAQEEERHRLIVLLQTPNGDQREETTYGGAAENAPRWAASMALNLVRRQV
jgi:nicotinamide-nucleotide amidase